MPEPLKDPAIKLFGRTIPVSDALPLPSVELAMAENGGYEVEAKDGHEEALIGGVEEVSCKEAMEMDNHDMSVVSSDGNEGGDVPKHSMDDNKKIPDKDGKVVVDSKSDHESTHTDDSSQDKVLKKPDKILPCPRCNSMDTKFCYFNNYNVNQPRHFCKNCQRYWTAGGTMRNVPVGAGRRKNKHSGSQYRHIVVGSDRLQATQSEATDLAQHQPLPCSPSAPQRPLNINGNILKFGAEGPLCESMASTLNIREPNKNCDVTSVARRDNLEEPSCASSVSTPNCAENSHTENATNTENIVMQGYMNGVAPFPHFQYYPGAPWAFPWGAGYLRPDNQNPNSVPWMAPPAFGPPALPFPLMSAPFWGCLPGWPNGAPNVPWVGTNGAVSPSSSTSNSGCSGNASPTLGKHSRDSNLQGEEKMEKSLWVPKTLRIDDPDEAAKSSIWATLGIKPDERGIFKPFQSKGESKAQSSEAAPRLHANPAAFSRSQSFQEST